MAAPTPVIYSYEELLQGLLNSKFKRSDIYRFRYRALLREDYEYSEVITKAVTSYDSYKKIITL